MRFLITLLALITGFSAADAAHPHGTEVRAAVTNMVEVALSATENGVSVVSEAPSILPPKTHETFFARIRVQTLPSTPVTRADLSRQ